MASSTSSFNTQRTQYSTATLSNSVSELKNVLNRYQQCSTYTRIADLREDSPYKIVKFERVVTPYGETIMAVLEGHSGEDFYVRVYLPRRFNDALTDRMIDTYNSGNGEFLHLVKKTAPAGTKVTPLEFV